LKGRVEGNDVAHGTDTPVGPARTSEECGVRIDNGSRGAERGDALPFDGSHVRLSLVTEEGPTVVRDLERDPHANRHYLA